MAEVKTRGKECARQLGQKGIAELNLVVGKEGRVTQVSVGGNVQIRRSLRASRRPCVRRLSPVPRDCASTTASTFASSLGTTDPASEYTETHSTLGKAAP